MPAAFTLVVVLLGADPVARFGGSPSDPIPADEAAAIALDTKEAQAEVAKKYGDKKPNELSNAERSQMIRDQADAEKKVLEKHGVDAHTWARQQMAKSPKEVAAQKDLEKQLAEKREADAKAAKDKDKGPKEITVQRGISDANPVTMEEAESAGPTVEQGLPAEATDDQAAAAGQDATDAKASAPAEKPAAKPAKGGGKSKGGGKR
jgi:hypothetical protein